MIRGILYGPVPSWRLGRSLGIDLLSTPEKACTFDCLYCQLGKTPHYTTSRGLFVTSERLADTLNALGPIEADYATFSGVGEPTLAANLGEAIEMAKNVLRLPVAVLTNASLLPLVEVRRDLAKADVVVAKVDAPSQELFQEINQPGIPRKLVEILAALGQFRMEYNGRLALQMMFVPSNQGFASQMAEIARSLQPDEVQLNTPLRPSSVTPLSPAEMESIEAQFSALPWVSVYRRSRPQVRPFDLRETLRRRPVL